MDRRARICATQQQENGRLDPVDNLLSDPDWRRLRKWVNSGDTLHFGPNAPQSPTSCSLSLRSICQWPVRTSYNHVPGLPARSLLVARLRNLLQADSLLSGELKIVLEGVSVRTFVWVSNQY